MSATKPTRIKKTIIRTRKIRGEESRVRSLGAAMGRLVACALPKENGTSRQSKPRRAGNRTARGIGLAQEIEEAAMDELVAAAHAAARHHLGTAVGIAYEAS